MKKSLATLLLFSVLFFFSPTPTYAANTHSTHLIAASSQYFSIADASQTGLDVTGDFTWSVWIAMASASGSWRGIFEKGPYGAGAYGYGSEYSADQGKLDMWIGDGVGLDFPNFTGVNLGTATTTLTWRRSGTTCSLWVNGTKQTDITCTRNPGGASNTGEFHIGLDIGTYIDANIDEFLFYNAALSDAQAAALYTDPCNPYTTGLVSQWAFDNNGNDSVGSNNLTNTNSATFVSPMFTCASATLPDQSGDFMIFE